MLGILTFIAALGLNLGGSVNAMADQLPNLIPLPASDLSIQQSKGKTYLKFSTTSWNNGTGPLEIHGGTKDRQAGRQKVDQRIYLEGGTYRDVFAGWFMWHKQHRHIHFDDYATYTLRAADSATIKATSAKTTFCIIDTTPMNLGLPGAPQSAHYGLCNSQVQGMSVGWGDTYGSHLAGQELNISNVPDGEYNLEIVVDPNSLIVESNENDNFSNVKIRINGNTVTTITN